MIFPYTLIAAGLLLTSLPGCATADSDTLPRQDAPNIGKSYRTTEPLTIVKWGSTMYLVKSLNLTGSSKKPSLIQNLPTGTLIKIVGTHTDNTITHGNDYWTEAETAGGEFHSLRLSDYVLRTLK